METYAVILLCFAAVIAANVLWITLVIVVFYCLCNGCSLRKWRPTGARTVAPPSSQGVVEGQNSNRLKDGEMVIFTGAGADRTAGSGGDDAAGSGSGCDGGGCGGCGGCDD